LHDSFLFNSLPPRIGNPKVKAGPFTTVTPSIASLQGLETPKGVYK